MPWWAQKITLTGADSISLWTWLGYWLYLGAITGVWWALLAWDASRTLHGLGWLLVGMVLLNLLPSDTCACCHASGWRWRHYCRACQGHQGHCWNSKGTKVTR